MLLMQIAGILIYVRCKEWVKFKRENNYSYADVKKHQQKLLIYTIIFAVGFLYLIAEIVF